MNAGKLNKRITFQREVRPAGVMKGGQSTWETVAENVWASVVDVLPSRSERNADGLLIASRPARIRTRYRTDILPGMRILYGTRVMRIVAGPAELIDKDGLEMMAEDYSTAGGAA